MKKNILATTLVCIITITSLANNPPDGNDNEYTWVPMQKWLPALRQIPVFDFCKKGKLEFFLYQKSSLNTAGHAIFYQYPKSTRKESICDSAFALGQMIRIEFDDKVPTSFLRDTFPSVLLVTHSGPHLSKVFTDELRDETWTKALEPENYKGEKQMLYQLMRGLIFEHTNQTWKMSFTVRCTGTNGGPAIELIYAQGQLQPFTIQEITTFILLDDDYWEERKPEALEKSISRMRAFEKEQVNLPSQPKHGEDQRAKE